MSGRLKWLGDLAGARGSIGRRKSVGAHQGLSGREVGRLHASCAMDGQPEPALRVESVSKRLGSTAALDAVTLELYPREVVGLVGENGAGKSTLLKVLSGLLPADAGQADDLRLVDCDRIQIQQVILNLIVNAIEAMGAVRDRLRSMDIGSARDLAGGVRVEVRDAGTGIDPAEMERLFEAFYTTKAEGIGMGLSISRSIIEAHGGRLWATANEPHGAVFQFSLPVEAPRLYPPAAEDA